MAVELAAVEGLIELKDEFTSKLGLAEAALHQFSEKNQQSLTACAEAVALVTAAVGATAIAVIELGKRGSDINDVDRTLEHFAGSADAASLVMERLRKGTHGTVDDFILAKDAAHLLSSGVSLTADEFGVLGEAAFVLQNRGLGGTQEMLDKVSDALVTGRTRTLAHTLGVVDAADEEQKLADKLGIQKDELDKSGKAMAARTAVMDILTRGVKDAGVQEKDFAEKIQAAEVAVVNWFDELGKGIASSPAFTAAMDAVETAVRSAFGGDTHAGIKATIKFIEQALVVSIDFARGLIDVGQAGIMVWDAIKAVILGVMTTTVAFVDLITEEVAVISKVGNAVGIISDESLASVIDLRTNLRGMTGDLAAQTLEAAKGAIGQSDFAFKLQAVNETLLTIKTATAAAAAEGEHHIDVAERESDGSQKLAAAYAASAKDMIDHAKLLARVEAENDEIAMSRFKATLKNLEAQTQASLHAYSFTEQIVQLQKLDAQEKQAAKTAFDSISTTKERSKVMQEYISKHIELMLQETEIQNKQAQIVNAAIMSELNATRELNAQYGRNIDGTTGVLTASQKLSIALDELHAKKVEGISQYMQEQLLMKQYTDALYNEAMAQETTVQALDKKTAALNRVAAAQDSLNGKTQQFSSFALNPANGNLEEQARARGGVLAWDEYGNPYVYIAGVNRPPPQHRAVGGDVEAGQSYIVGEERAEVFVPRSAGTILPSTNAGGVVVNQTNHITVPAGPETARQIMGHITKFMRQGRQWPAA